MTILPSPQQLRYLVALAESRHFGRAALACAVTQSTLSAGILALERQLDAQVLDRTAGRHVVFTPLGLDLVDRARAALAALEAVAETAAAAREPMSGPLRLGVIPTIGPFLLPRLMPVLRGAFPRLRLFLREDTTARLVDRLEANRLDVLLLALPCDCGGADAMPVARDEFLVALPPGHSLAASPVVPVAALANERLLLLEDGHCLRDQALAVCGLLGGDRGDQDGFAATSLHTLVQMVAGGLGITLLPRLAVAAGIIEGTGLILRPLAGAGAWRTLGLAWRPNAPRASDYRALGPHLAETCRDAFGSPAQAAAVG
ncbi:MAG: hydrogen peroxide-inducible genes activator [Acetobacteraceae bacterium]